MVVVVTDVVVIVELVAEVEVVDADVVIEVAVDVVVVRVIQLLRRVYECESCFAVSLGVDANRSHRCCTLVHVKNTHFLPLLKST